MIKRTPPPADHDRRCIPPNGQTLVGCDHPSRQNTNTGKLTAPMMESVFRKAKKLIAVRA